MAFNFTVLSVDEQRRDDHVAFVSGHSGTSLAEISLVSAVGFVGLLMRNLAIAWLFPSKNFATGTTWERWFVAFAMVMQRFYSPLKVLFASRNV